MKEVYLANSETPFVAVDPKINEKAGLTKKMEGFVTGRRQAVMQDIESHERQIASDKSSIKGLEKRIKEYDKRKKEIETANSRYLNIKDTSDLRKLIKEDISVITKFDDFESIEFDEKERIIVTTKPMTVKKGRWEKVVGRYQIRIDFNQGGISSGVRVMNIDRIHNEIFDSPTVRGTECCWGNVQHDVENDYREKNLYDLILDMFAYVKSPNDSHGFITSWAKWYDGSYERIKGWSFQKQDVIDFYNSNVNGINIRLIQQEKTLIWSITSDNVRKNIDLILQNFEDDDIKYGLPVKNDEEVLSACSSLGIRPGNAYLISFLVKKGFSKVFAYLFAKKIRYDWDRTINRNGEKMALKLIQLQVQKNGDLYDINYCLITDSGKFYSFFNFCTSNDISNEPKALLESGKKLIINFFTK